MLLNTFKRQPQNTTYQPIKYIENGDSVISTKIERIKKKKKQFFFSKNCCSTVFCYTFVLFLKHKKLFYY